MLTFLIPVRHPDSVSDWGQVKRLMADTFRSIAGQTHPDWACYIAAEASADLPDLPPNFHVVRTEIPKPYLPDLNSDREGNYTAVKRDKGARALAALEAARPEGHVMVVDYDDLVSNRLAGLAAAHPDASGWYFDRGFLYSGGPWMIRYPLSFYTHCGSSLIVHVRHMPLVPTGQTPDPLAVEKYLGSHMFIKDDLDAAGTPLEPLPFPGALYRIGHGYGVSRSKALGRRLINSDLIRRPGLQLRYFLGLRRIGAAAQAEFFGTP